MEMSKAAVAAIHGLIYLDNRENPTPTDVKEMARDLRIPPGYLAKIFQRLARTNFVYSRRGPQGGYVLASEPSEISFMDIIDAIDGPIVTGRCDISPSDHCRFFPRCKIREALDALKQQTRELYKNITLDMFEEQFETN